VSVQPIEFYSAGCRLAGTLRLPDRASPVPVVVQGPGWLGLQDAKLYQPYHEALLGAGIAVLSFDYRGFGGSEGDATYLDPTAQVLDWFNAVSYASGHPDLDAARIGVFGSGGTGGGNAIVLTAMDPRVRVTVSQVPIADGRDWLRRMRSADDWAAFLGRLDAERVRVAEGGEPALVSPRGDIAPPNSERIKTTVKSDVDTRVPALVQLGSADAIFRYRPIDHVANVAPRPLMLVCVEGDAVTPDDHAWALYGRVTGPKRLVVQTATTHYAAYAQYRTEVTRLIVDWFLASLVGAGADDPANVQAEVIRLSPAAVPA